MTTQITDEFIIDDSKYSMVAMSEPIGFNPRKYGIIPHWLETACWRGYYCTYNITKKGIFLDELNIYSDEGHYPAIEGIEPEKDCGGYRKYANMNLKMDFNGKILIGADFLMDYHPDMGYPDAWAYEKLIEIIFKKGKPQKAIDHSKFAAKIREELREADDFDASEFVAHKYAGCEEKYWWLSRR